MPAPPLTLSRTATAVDRRTVGPRESGPLFARQVAGAQTLRWSTTPTGGPTRALAVAAIVTLTLATACGGGSETEPEAQEAQGATPTETTALEAARSPEGAASPAGDMGAQTLVGRVGEEGDPEAFVITLTDESGQEVTSLPAGEFGIQVMDPSLIHNFHLTDPGGVDEPTTVPDTTETT